MKRIIVTIVFVFAVNAILAQTYNMKIKQGTGTTHSVTSTIDEITFINTTTTPFVCGDVMLYGGETYPTILIGSQCWFQKNLNIGTRINSLDGNGNPQAQTNNSTIEKFCYSDNDASCVTYGGLYQWNEAMQYVTTPGAKGICPLGWHIPTLAQFTTLQTSVGGSLQGNSLKALGQGTFSFVGQDGRGTNTSGFSALLAGWRLINGVFVGVFDGVVGDGVNAVVDFWSSTEYDATNEYTMALREISDLIYLTTFRAKSYGISVRCVKDDD